MGERDWHALQRVLDAGDSYEKQSQRVALRQLAAPHPQPWPDAVSVVSGLAELAPALVYQGCSMLSETKKIVASETPCIQDVKHVAVWPDAHAAAEEALAMQAAATGKFRGLRSVSWYLCGSDTLMDMADSLRDPQILDALTLRLGQDLVPTRRRQSSLRALGKLVAAAVPVKSSQAPQSPVVAMLSALLAHTPVLRSIRLDLLSGQHDSAAPLLHLLCDSALVPLLSAVYLKGGSKVTYQALARFLEVRSQTMLSVAIEAHNQSAGAAFPALALCSNLRSLTLHDCLPTRSSTAEIAALRHLASVLPPQLHELHITGSASQANDIARASLSLVSGLARSNTGLTGLRKLCVKACGIDEQGAKQLASLLPRTTALTHLDVSRNSIGGSGIIAIAKALPQVRATLQSVEFYCDTTRIEPLAMQQVLCALHQLPNLTSLEHILTASCNQALQNCVFAELLPSMHRLQKLHVSLRMDTKPDIPALTNALPLLQGIRDIILLINVHARDHDTALAEHEAAGMASMMRAVLHAKPVLKQVKLGWNVRAALSKLHASLAHTMFPALAAALDAGDAPALSRLRLRGLESPTRQLELLMAAAQNRAPVLSMVNLAGMHSSRLSPLPAMMLDVSYSTGRETHVKRFRKFLLRHGNVERADDLQAVPPPSLPSLLELTATVVMERVSVASSELHRIPQLHRIPRDLWPGQLMQKMHRCLSCEQATLQTRSVPHRACHRSSWYSVILCCLCSEKRCKF